MEAIRPSSDLRNYYNEISKQCHEERTPVIITVNRRGDTAILGLQDYYQMKSELERCRMWNYVRNFFRGYLPI